jgi:hypothetical protein
MFAAAHESCYARLPSQFRSASSQLCDSAVGAPLDVQSTALTKYLKLLAVPA